MNLSDENQKPHIPEKKTPQGGESGISGQQATPAGAGASGNPGKLIGGSSPEHEPVKREEAGNEPVAPFRLIDEIIGYLRTRQKEDREKSSHQVDEERLARAALYQLRKHPVPTSLLGFSALWLLFAHDKEEKADLPLEPEMMGPDWGKAEGASSRGEEAESEIVSRVENAVVAQVREGYDYTSEQLKEVAARYPWAAAAVAIGGGLLAAIYFPKRNQTDTHRGSPPSENHFGTGPRPEKESVTGEGIGHEPITGKSYIRE